jgi:hypothetical protein
MFNCLQPRVSKSFWSGVIQYGVRRLEPILATQGTLRGVTQNENPRHEWWVRFVSEAESCNAAALP